MKIFFFILMLACFFSLFSCVSSNNIDVKKMEELPVGMTPKVINSDKIADLYRIISFDGGGIKGVLTAKLLTMIQAELPQVFEFIDLYAGTSTGSIIALALADNKTPGEILDLYLRNGQDIFTPYHKILDLGLTDPLYTNQKLKKILQKEFGAAKTLSQLDKKVVICSFKLLLKGNWSPVFMTNFSGTPYEEDLMVDAALRSSAAPVYFPSYQNFIDGGVVANNPAGLALAMALDPNLANVPLDKIRLFSISTGTTTEFITGDVQWGALEWLNPEGKPPTPLISILMGGVQEFDDYQCQMILQEKYRRLDVVLDFSYPMDDWKNIEKLIQAAENYPLKHPDQWNELLQWLKIEFLE